MKRRYKTFLLPLLLIVLSISPLSFQAGIATTPEQQQLSSSQSSAGYDGSDLWLRYVPVSDTALLAQYRGIVKSIMVDETNAEPLYRFADTPLFETAYGAKGIQHPEGAEESVPETRLAAARMELDRGLDGLLGQDIPVVAPNPDDIAGAVVVGTPAGSSIIQTLDLSDALTAVGEEGYIIRSLAKEGQPFTVIAGNTEIGALYGAFAFLRFIQTQEPITALKLSESPRVNHRRLNGWNTERLYAANGPEGSNGDSTGSGNNQGNRMPFGESGDLFNWDLSPNIAGNTAHSQPTATRMPVVLDRYIVFARACASLGINEININNVNTNTAFLTEYVIRQEAALADALRPYGVKIAVSINYGQPTVAICNQPGTNSVTVNNVTVALPADETKAIGTANTVNCSPYNPAYQTWWRDKTIQILKKIPDFAGYTCKANSEGQSGPQTYGFSHAEGAMGVANLLRGINVPTDAAVNCPGYAGVTVPVFWRSFVYDAAVDNDRLNRAYIEFGPGDDEDKFLPNTFVQTKNGPLDFQPREPFHPMFGRMKNTNQAIELQITKEYLGQNKSFCYLGPMWEEIFKADTYAEGEGTLVGEILDGTAQGQSDTAIVGVHNLGNAANFTGHHFDQSNFYVFGRMAWDWTVDSDDIAAEWTRMTWSNDDAVVDEIVDMMMGSREAVVSYQEPFGLMHQQYGTGGGHYPPVPWDWSSQDDWGPVYYNKADRTGLGWDRTEQGRLNDGLPVPAPGSADEKYYPLVNQYFPPLRDRFSDIDAVPENLIAAFHHVPWDRIMQSGRTFWTDLVYRYQMGVQYVTALKTRWNALAGAIDEKRFNEVADKLSRQEADAARWRDESIAYWQTQNRLPMPTDTAPLSVKLVIDGVAYGGFDLSHQIDPNSTASLNGGNSPRSALYREYTVEVPYGTKDLTITAVEPFEEDAVCTIVKQAGNMADTAQIIVTKRDFFGELQQDYTVRFAYDTKLKSIRLNGRALSGFDPETADYAVYTTVLPAISAQANDPAATVTVTQPETLPGTATITIGNNGAPERIYTVAVGQTTADSDEFDAAALKENWQFIRENPENWSLTDNLGALTISANVGKLSSARNDDATIEPASNILVQDAPFGDWTIETKIHLSDSLQRVGEQAGVIAYTDDDNFISLGWARVTPPGNFPANLYNLVMTREENGGATVVSHAGVDIQRAAGEGADTIWLRLIKEGDDYMGYYSSDGIRYKTARFYTTITPSAPKALSLTAPAEKVGVYTYYNHPAGGFRPGTLAVQYDYFRVTSDQDRSGGFSGTIEDEAAFLSLDSETGVSGDFYVVIYQNGDLSHLYQEPFAETAGEGTGQYEARIPIDPAYIGNGYEIKAFAWDDDFVPLTEMLQLHTRAD